MREAEVIYLVERRRSERTSEPGAFARIALGLAVLVMAVCLLLGKIP